MQTVAPDGHCACVYVSVAGGVLEGLRECADMTELLGRTER